MYRVLVAVSLTTLLILPGIIACSAEPKETKPSSAEKLRYDSRSLMDDHPNYQYGVSRGELFRKNTRAKGPTSPPL